MSRFNRIMACLALITLGVVSGYVFMLTLGFVPDPDVLGPPLAALFSPIAAIATPLNRVALSVLSACMTLLSLGLLALELRVPVDQRHPIVLDRDAHGLVTIDHASVRELVERTLMNLPEVRAVDVGLSLNDAGALLLRCYVTTAPNAVMTELGPTVRQEAIHRIQAQLGLEVEDVSTRFSIERFRSRKRPLL